MVHTEEGISCGCLVLKQNFIMSMDIPQSGHIDSSSSVRPLPRRVPFARGLMMPLCPPRTSREKLWVGGLWGGEGGNSEVDSAKRWGAGR